LSYVLQGRSRHPNRLRWSGGVRDRRIDRPHVTGQRFGLCRNGRAMTLFCESADVFLRTEPASRPLQGSIFHPSSSSERNPSSNGRLRKVAAHAVGAMGHYAAHSEWSVTGAYPDRILPVARCAIGTRNLECRVALPLSRYASSSDLDLLSASDGHVGEKKDNPLHVNECSRGQLHNQDCEAELEGLSSDVRGGAQRACAWEWIHAPGDDLLPWLAPRGQP